VARAAGVHPGTVSRVLHPRTRDLVNDETAARIERVVEELDYTPNVVARGLRTQRTGLVATVIPDLTNPVFPPIVRGIEDRLGQAGYMTLLVNTDNDPEREANAFSIMHQRQVDGLIAATAIRGDRSIPQMAAEGVPIVLVNRSLPRSKVPAVLPDDRDGMRQSVDHVVGLGHRQIVHVGGPTRLPTAAARRSGFRAAMKRAGLDPDAPVIEAAELTSADGERAATEALGARRRPTAIVAGNDLLALGAYRAAAALGLDIPGDVSIVGFNDMPFVDSFQPPLTTVRIPHHELGYRAADVLLDWIDSADDERSEPPQGNLRLPVQLVARGSTAPPPAKRSPRRKARAATN